MAQEKIMAEGPVNSEAAPAAKSPIPGMPQELFDTLRQRHSFETIQNQRFRHQTHEDFLADAEKEAERIHLTSAKLSDAIQNPIHEARADIEETHKDSAGETSSITKQSRPPTKRHGFTEEQVLANAALPDEDRIKVTEGLLGPLTEEQRKTLLRMHEVGQGQQGKDGDPAGVFNYRLSQLLRKEKIGREESQERPGKEIFIEEQISILLESGLAGSVHVLERIRAAKQSPVTEAVQVVSAALEANLADLAFDDDALHLIAQSRQMLEHFLYPTSEKEQKELDQILNFVLGQIQDKYLEAVNPPTVSRYAWDYAEQPPPKSVDDRIKDIYKVFGVNEKTGQSNYEESFWNYGEATLKRIFGQNANIAELRKNYRGVAGFIASRVAIAIEKELRGIRPPVTKEEEQRLIGMSTKDRRRRFWTMPQYKNLENIGDLLLVDIKGELNATRGEREKKRRAERKRATATERLRYNDWREKFDFTWAETVEELDDSVEDWLNYFERALPEEAEESVYQEVQKGMQNALSSLEKAAALRLHLEPGDSRLHALREKIVGHVTTIAGARFLESKNGFEHYIKLRLDFAANYNAHFDRIYKRKGFAIMADKISEDDGLIYWGGPEDVKKPMPGDTKTHRGGLEQVAIEYAMNNELYITEEDFENAELGEREIRKAEAHSNLSFNEAQQRIARIMEQRRQAGDRSGRYGWEDGIEELLLYDSRGFARARAITDPAKRAEAIERVQRRTAYFRKIKHDLDKEDMCVIGGREVSLASLTEEQRRGVIRQRILDKIAEVAQQKTLQRFDRLIKKGADQATLDKFLWDWVRSYNEEILRLKPEKGSNAEPFFPSHWDMERLSINRPEDLIDRELKKEEFRSFIEEVDDPYKGFDEDGIREQVGFEYRREIRGELEAKLRREVQAAIAKKVSEGRLSSGDAARETSRLMYEQRGALSSTVVEEVVKERDDVLKARIEDVLFKRREREARAKRNFTLNVAQDKFIELEARWGGLVSRKIGPDGKMVMVNIHAEAARILKAQIDAEEAGVERRVQEWKYGYEDLARMEKVSESEIKEKIDEMRQALIDREIDKEAAKIRQGYVKENNRRKETDRKTDEQLEAEVKGWRKTYEKTYHLSDEGEKDFVLWRDGWMKAHPTAKPEQLEARTIEQRRRERRNCTFAATLGLREIGIAHDLPIWNFSYYGDVQEIGDFALLVGLTDDEKGDLVGILEKARRATEAVYAHLAAKHMDGEYLVVKDDSDLLLRDADGLPKTAHEESEVRPRVINEGGVLKLRDLLECRFMISTSGGVKVKELISKLADLGVYDELWEMGCKDKREWQGFRKRRNKWELRRLSYYNIRENTDPITHVQRIHGASKARKFLVGGEVEGQGHVPGVLNEPFNGLWRYRDEFIEAAGYIAQSLQEVMGSEYKPPELMSKEDWVKFLKRDKVGSTVKILNPEMLAKFKADILEILSHEEVGEYLTIAKKDKMVSVGGEILKFLMAYMDSRRYVMNKVNFAAQNWQYDNELFMRAFFGETRKTKPYIAKKGDLKRVDTDPITGKKIPIYYEYDTFLSETGGEKVGGEHLAYAAEGRTAVAISLFRLILTGSSYHTLEAADVRTLEGKAWKTKEAMDKRREKLEEGAKLPTEVQTKIDNRIRLLKSQNTTPEKIEIEKKRLENEYYDEQVLMKSPDAWQARLLAA